MDLQAYALTPVWTGNIDMKADQEIFATSVLGSMRWTLEALLRGVGAQAPEPLPAPVYDASRGPLGGLDPASVVFGATGWRRRFRLEVLPEPKANHKYFIRKIDQRVPGGHGRSWFFKSDAIDGPFLIRIESFREEKYAEMAHELLYFMSRTMGIGARWQMGFGIFTLVPVGQRPKTCALRDYLASHSGNSRADGLPALPDMFWAEVQPKQAGQTFVDDDTFGIKVDLRNLFRGHGEDDLRHELFGHIQRDDRRGSRVFVSRPFNKGQLIRIWGWVPSSGPTTVLTRQRAMILDRIRNYVQGTFRTSWMIPTSTLAFYDQISGYNRSGNAAGQAGASQ